MMGVFDKLVMTDEEKEQARQLNKISYINALNTHNQELQQKVLMLTAANEELHKQAEMNGRLLSENAELRVENETLRRDVKTAVMGDSAELQDVKRENEKLCEALKTVCLGVVAERENLDWFIMDGAALRVARAAIRDTE